MLPRSVTSCLAAAWNDGDVGYGWDGYVGGYELVAEPPPGDLVAAIGAVEDMLAPAGEKLVFAELTRLRVLTVSREHATADLELMAAAYADELSQYPADALRAVLREYPRTHRFWPSISELLPDLERIVRPRKALLAALTQGYREPELSPDWVRPTPEDIAAAEDLLRKNGISLDHRGRVRPLEREPITEEHRAQMDRELAEFRARFAARAA